MLRVLGALDGDLTVGQVVPAVAQVLDLDVTQLAGALLPEIRQALLDQFLIL